MISYQMTTVILKSKHHLVGKFHQSRHASYEMHVCKWSKSYHHPHLQWTTTTEVKFADATSTLEAVMFLAETSSTQMLLTRNPAVLILSHWPTTGRCIAKQASAWILIQQHSRQQTRPD
jgi:hypothetical protein